MSIQTILQKKFLDGSANTGKLVMQPVAGGSINDCYQVQFSGRQLFCKVNSATKFPHLFKAEKRSLELLATPDIIHIPSVVDCFEEEGLQFLLLQWVQEGERTLTFWQKFGEQLAALHQLSNKYHGRDEDNFMGSVPQKNTMHPLWSEFFGAERLRPMIKLCVDKHLLSKKHLDSFAVIQKRLSSIFEEEAPSLLHGDLWSGNFMCNEASEPVLIDPAVYFGHRSVDLGMTTLFGGFHPGFYEAYHYHFPLPPNHKEQWAICNLYPLLIHLFLFGSGYLLPIERTLEQFD